MSVEGRGNAPNASPAASQFGLFFVGVFDHSIRGIGDNSVNTVGGSGLEPIDAVRMVECRASVGERWFGPRYD